MVVSTSRFLSKLVFVASAVVGLTISPAISADTCDPARGRVFVFASSTGLASLTVRNLAATPGSKLLTATGALKLGDGTNVPVGVRAKVTSSIQQTVTYKVNGTSGLLRARGAIRMSICPAQITKARVS